MLTIVVLWLRLDPDSRQVFINTEDDSDLKDQVKTLTILYLTPPHDPASKIVINFPEY